MKPKRKLIYDEDLFVKIIIISLLAMWFYGGRTFIVIMWIYFFINERVEKKKYEKAMKYIKDHDFPFY